MSPTGDDTTYFGSDNAYAIEDLGRDNAGHVVSIARYNGVIIGYITKYGDEWTAHCIEGWSFRETHNFHRCVCYLLEDYVRDLMGSIDTRKEFALRSNNPVQEMAEIKETAALLGKVISDYRQIAPKGGWSDGLPVEKYDPTEDWRNSLDPPY